MLPEGANLGQENNIQWYIYIIIIKLMIYIEDIKKKN